MPDFAVGSPGIFGKSISASCGRIKMQTFFDDNSLMALAGQHWINDIHPKEGSKRYG
jgi:hypothetical protein